ncbi:unnamed protein product [Fusarium graminearum]|nr:unnamed protein product [Fusarium graminearum]
MGNSGRLTRLKLSSMMDLPQTRCVERDTQTYMKPRGYCTLYMLCRCRQASNQQSGRPQHAGTYDLLLKTPWVRALMMLNVPLDWEREFVVAQADRVFISCDKS